MLAFAQGRVRIGGQNLGKQNGGRRRQIVRDELVEQVARELGELVLQLQLHARRQKGRSLQQAGDHRVGPVAHQAAQTLGDAGIFLAELARLLVQQLQLAIVEVEELPVHRRSTAGSR